MPGYKLLIKRVINNLAFSFCNAGVIVKEPDIIKSKDYLIVEILN